MAVTLTQREPGSWSLAGSFDELSDYAPIVRDGSKRLRLDMRGIKSITSHGIRFWIDFLDSITDRSVELYGCPSVFLDAADLLIRTLPSKEGISSIKTCWLLYSCEACQKQFGHEFRREQMSMDLITAVHCPRCRQKLESDENLEVYCEMLAQRT